VRTEIKRTIIAELKIREDMDAVIRRKLQSFSKKIVEEVPVEILYRKYYRKRR
jgi:hypothetical protein